MIRIEGLLRQEIGLDAASIGSSQIHRTIRLRMKRLGVKKTEDYFRLLGTSPKELEELVEAVVVTETWFFRDGAPFEAFKDLAQRWFGQNPATALRVLSIPCSSGEEPYSLAMALLDANIPSHQFVIHGTDISLHALARAKQAVYGKNSFRAKDLSFRERHFGPSKDGYVLHQRVRDCVQFHRANLLGDDFLVGQAQYHFIFCRNLLIYFDRATQVRALEKIDRLLHPDGILFVGPAELPLVVDNDFVSANVPMAFACRKAATERRNRAANSAVKPIKLPSLTQKPAPPPIEWVTPPKPPAPTTVARAPEAVLPSLDDARKMADAGRLAEAAIICEGHMRANGPSAQAYYLMGLVRDASSDATQAMVFYRKALYLEPSHYETLVHMALLLEKAGDANGARSFKRRAQKAQPQN